MFVKLLFFLVVHALNLQRSDLEYFSLAISIPDKQFRNTRLPTLIAKGHNYDVQLSVTFFVVIVFKVSVFVSSKRSTSASVIL